MYLGEKWDEEKRNPVKQELRQKHRLQTYLRQENQFSFQRQGQDELL